MYFLWRLVVIIDVKDYYWIGDVFDELPGTETLFHITHSITRTVGSSGILVFVFFGFPRKTAIALVLRVDL